MSGRWKCLLNGSARNIRWTLFALALLVRLLYVLQGYDVPPQDTPDYDEIAHNLLRGEGFVARENWFGFEIRAWRAPFYPFFLAFVYGLFGYSHTLVRLFQCIVDAGTVVLLSELGRKLDRSAAPIAGVIAVFYGPIIAATSEVMTETWFTFWLVLAAYFLVRSKAARPHAPWRNLAGGAAIGLAALTRPVGLIFLPALALIAALSRSRTDLSRLLWAGLAAALVLLPWTIRNERVFGVWPVLSTHGGFILARSNSSNPDWRQPDGWGIERELFEQIPSEIERDRRWFKQGITFIRDHPATYFRWVAERFLRFWYFFRPEYNFWYAAVLPFFLLGLLRFWKTGEYPVPGSLILLSGLAFWFVLYGSVRFRLPLEPFLILFAAAWLRRRIETRGTAQTGILIGIVAGINLLIYIADAPLRAALLNLLRSLNLK